MSNKRLKIENLENLQELTTEKFSSINGGLSIQKIDEIRIDPDHPIDPDPEPIPHPVICLPGLKEHEISMIPNIIRGAKDDYMYVGWCPLIL